MPVIDIACYLVTNAVILYIYVFNKAPKVQQWIQTLNPDVTPAYAAWNLPRKVGEYENVAEVWKGHPTCDIGTPQSGSYTGWITDVACYNTPDKGAFDTGLSVMKFPELHTKRCLYVLHRQPRNLMPRREPP